MKAKISPNNPLDPFTMDYHINVMLAISLLNRYKTPLYLCNGIQLTNTLFHVENGDGTFKHALLEFQNADIAHTCGSYLKNAFPAHLSKLVEMPANSVSKKVGIITNGTDLSEYEFVLDTATTETTTPAILPEDEDELTIYVPLEVPEQTPIKEVAETKIEKQIEEKLNNKNQQTDMNKNANIKKEISAVMRERELNEGADYSMTVKDSDGGAYAEIALKGGAQKLANLVVLSLKNKGLKAVKLKGTNTISVEIVKGVEAKPSSSVKGGDKKAAKQNKPIQKRKYVRRVEKPVAKKVPVKAKAKTVVAKPLKPRKAKTGLNSDALIEQIFCSLGEEKVKEIALGLGFELLDETSGQLDADTLFAVLKKNNLAIVPVNEAVTDVKFTVAKGFTYKVNAVGTRKMRELLNA